MGSPNATVDQNLLPVQAYFDVYGNFQTFIGQGQPFYAIINPSQSGLNITNSTINSTTIGATTPSTGIFTNIGTTTGTISTTPSANADIANKFYVDTVAQGLGPKAACAVGTTVNITLSGLQSIDGYTTLSGDRVLVKNQGSSQFNGIYNASASTWTRAVDMDVWSEVSGAYTVLLNGTQANTGWVCTASAIGTINVTAMPWVQFSVVNTYYAGTGLTLSSSTFSITNTGVTASTYGSASIVPVIAVNAQGQITSATNTNISIAPSQINATIPNSGLTNSSISINGNSVSLGGSTTITASTTNALTISTGLSGTSFNGSTPVTIAIDSSVVTLTGLQVLTNKTLTSPVIGTIVNTGTLTLPTSTDTLIGRDTSDILTNKTIASGSNTITGLVNANLSGTAGITNANLQNSAITINGNSVSLGGSTTVTSNTTNALTMNNSGTGATSGTTFNGSAVQTISYNTIGASPLAGSSSIVTVGTIASGTWNGGIIGLAYGGTNANLTASAGSVPYSTASALAFTAVGSVGQVLTSQGTSAPIWANNSATISVTDDTSSATVEYPTMARITTGNINSIYTSSTKLSFVSSTGTLSATVFSGGATITSGTINNTTVGATTAATGRFSTLYIAP